MPGGPARPARPRRGGAGSRHRSRPCAEWPPSRSTTRPHPLAGPRLGPPAHTEKHLGGPAAHPATPIRPDPAPGPKPPRNPPSTLAPPTRRDPRPRGGDAGPSAYRAEVAGGGPARAAGGGRSPRIAGMKVDPIAAPARVPPRAGAAHPRGGPVSSRIDAAAAACRHRGPGRPRAPAELEPNGAVRGRHVAAAPLAGRRRRGRPGRPAAGCRR